MWVQRRWLLSAVAVIVAGAGLGELVAPGRPPRFATAAVGGRTAQLSALHAPARAFAISAPRVLIAGAPETRWASVLRDTVARVQPNRQATPVMTVAKMTPEGTSNLVVAMGERVVDGVTWVRASLADLPNGRIGWLPRSALGGWSFVNTRVVVNRGHLTLTLFRDRAVVYEAPVGIGTVSNPTPAGSFYIRDRLTSFTDPAYGPLAFGTSARSPTETDWPAGGFIGIHGTDEPNLIPGRVSHGYIRLTNRDIERLGRLMPVGTPVVIQ